MGDSRFCAQCGTPRTGALSFCRNCGYNYDAETPIVSTPERPTTSSTPVPPAFAAATAVTAVPRAEPKWYRRRLGIAGIAVAVFVLLGVIGQLTGASAPAAASLLPTTQAADVPIQTEAVTETEAPTATLPPATLAPIVTAKPPPAPPPPSYATLSSRQWARLVKSPDNYIGDTYRIWACITQFDAATGDDTFRAQGSYKKETYWYSDGDNALFTGDSSDLADFVQDDIVVMNVTVLGSYTYDTQIGGSTTVPSFIVDKISRKGDCS
jgi:hypothetical protein